MDLYLTLQEDILRVALQAIMAGSTVIPKRTYRITNGVGSTAVILVKGLTTNTVTGYAINETTNEWGTYNIGTDVFTVQGAIGDFIPYDAANQTQDIQGIFNVEPAVGSGQNVAGVGTNSGWSIEDGAFGAVITGVSAESILRVTENEAEMAREDLGSGDQTSVGNGDDGGDAYAYIEALGGGQQTSVKCYADRVNVVTPFVAGAGNPTGMRLVGQNSAGDVEFESDAIPQQVATEVNVNSHGFVVGDWLYLNGATWTKAIATSESASNVLGVVSEVIDANNFVLTNVGYIATLSGLGASGLVFYLSPTTAGAMTTTEPTASGQFSKMLFISQTNSAGWVIQSRASRVHYEENIDWSTGAAVTGYAGALTTNLVYYTRLGKMVTVHVYFNGTSNATTLTFTLPYAAYAEQFFLCFVVSNNGAASNNPGRIQLTAGSTTATATRDRSGTAWTNSGAKVFIGSFTYLMQ